MTLPTSYGVFIEFVAGSWTNITPDTRALSIERRVASLYAGLAAAEMILEVDNMAGNFSPANSASIYGNGVLKPNLRTRVQATHSGSLRTLFTGKLDRILVSPALSDPRRS